MGGIVIIVMLNVQIWWRTHHLQRCAAASPLGPGKHAGWAEEDDRFGG